MVLERIALSETVTPSQSTLSLTAAERATLQLYPRLTLAPSIIASEISKYLAIVEGYGRAQRLAQALRKRDHALGFAFRQQNDGKLIAGKPRLSFIVNGALTSLPPAGLVTGDPAGKPW